MFTFLRQLLAFILFIVALIITIVVFAITIPLFWLMLCLEMAVDLLIEVIFVPFGGLDEFDESNDTDNFLVEISQHDHINPDNTRE